MTSLLRLIATIALCLAAAGVGGIFTLRADSTWYDELRQPPWSPPDWLYSPVWLTLYTMMGIALWLVWNQPRSERRRVAIVLFLTQLVLNVAWTALFFAMQSPGWALVDIIVLWLAIAATFFAFARVHQLAAWLLVPYILWVTFAGALNVAIWRLNA